jgi:hypothetical protein
MIWLHTCFVEYFECDYNLGQSFVANYFHNISFGPDFFSSLVGDEYESVHWYREAEVVVFDLARLAEAALLSFLLLPPLLFSLVPVGDEIARRNGGAEALSKAIVVC